MTEPFDPPKMALRRPGQNVYVSLTLSFSFDTSHKYERTKKTYDLMRKWHSHAWVGCKRELLDETIIQIK